jgi:hypothetical protein
MAESLISFTPSAILSRLGSIRDQSLSSVLSESPGVDRSSLLKQLSLHLPRLEAAQIYDGESVAIEARRLAKRLESLRAPHSGRVPLAKTVGANVSDLHFFTLEDEIARPILECFHYILSHRENSRHFGLKWNPGSDEWPVVMASLSEFDLKNVEPALTNRTGQTIPALVLSRVFAFPGAPRNALSFLMAKLRHWVTENQPQVQVLLTYVNPNIGFSGASYKADNWRLIGEEHGTRYLYLNGDYKTDRFLYAYFARPIDSLLSAPGSCISASKHKLMPLKIYLRSILSSEAPNGKYHFERWRLS